MPQTSIALDIQRHDDMTVVTIEGSRVPADMGDSFEEQIVNVIGDLPTPRVLIDFGQVTFVSSSILGKLIKLDGRVTDAQGQLTLCGLSVRIAEVFKITGLEKLFSIHATREDALQSFL
jgi:anti-sigma B factor antagonist